MVLKIVSLEERPLYYIPAPQYEKINQICNDIDRYPSFREFLADAMEVFITWWTKPEKIQDSIQKMWPDVTDEMKGNIKTNAPQFYSLMEEANKQNSGVRSQSSGLVFKYKNSLSLEERPLYYIPAPQFEKINQICNDIDRYPSWHDFMQESVEIFITWWTEPWMTQHMIQKLWPDVTDEMKENTRINAPTFYKAMEDANKQFPDPMQQLKSSSQKTMQISPTKTVTIQSEPSDEPLINQQRNQQRTMKNDLKETYDYISKLFEQNQLKKPSTFLKYDGYPVIWAFYSRFFPVKLALSVLAHIIYQDKEQSISLEMFSKRAYDVAVAYSEELRFYELERKTSRNKKVSTGLPSPPLATKSRTPEEIAKFVASKDRFIQHFIGKRKKKDEEFFDGALNAMGLVHVSDDEKPKVSLSRKGAEFYLLSNPIIHDKIYTRAISEQEKDFILEHIIPGFELENKLVDAVRKKIVQKSKEKKLEDQSINTTKINSLFEIEILDWIHKNEKEADDHHISRLRMITDNDKKKKNEAEKLRTSYRVATMGRLAEIGAVKWTIDKHGNSFFTLPK